MPSLLGVKATSFIRGGLLESDNKDRGDIISTVSQKVYPFSRINNEGINEKGINEEHSIIQGELII